MFRQAAIRNVRLFSTSPAFRKSPVETAADAVKSVDRAVSDTLVKGIEKGEEGAAKAKEAAGMTAGEAQQKATEVKKEAEKKAQDVKKETEKKM